MFKNYLVIAFRNLWRNKAYSLINIFGLAIGLASTILLLLYIIHELSYDSYHQKKDRIYRVHYISEKSGIFSSSAITTAGIGHELIKEMPEIETMMRFSSPRNGYFSFDEKNFHINNITYVDSSFFSVFDYDLIEGNPKLVLQEPFTVVLSESTAEKIFGNEDPIGKVISFNAEEPLVVTGIIIDFPSNSHMQFNAMISFVSLYHKKNMYLDFNGGHNYYTYLLLKNEGSVKQLENRFPDFLEKNINYLYRTVGVVMHMKLLPLSKIHLFANVEADIDTKGNLTNIFIYATIAIFILLIACINFMNLATARAIRRFKEVGLRKVIGATKGQIIRQFLGESVMICFISFIIAIIIIEIFQRDFNTLIGATLNLYSLSNIWIIFILIGLTAVIGLLAGSYPALYVSRFQPVAIMKGNFLSVKSKSIVRNTLVIIQFFISASLIICTIIIYSQLDYIKNKGLGYNADNILNIPFPSENSTKNFKYLKEQISNIAGVESVAGTSMIPGWGMTRNGYIPEGLTESIMFHALYTDEDYFDLLEIPVIEGRMYSKDIASDQEVVLINEALAKKLGWTDPIGKIIRRNKNYKVIGVVKDFHFAPLHHEIAPMVISIRNSSFYNYLSLKVNPERYSSIMSDIENTWNKINPGEPFNASLQESYSTDAYKAEAHFGKVFLNFSVLAIFIACLGLLGLVAYATEQRRKEIGIRKVMGATFSRILFLLSFDFTKWVLIANLLAVPISFYFMNKWLQNFAFATSIKPWVFIITVIFTIAISLITIFFLTRKLANTNPANILKYE